MRGFTYDERDREQRQHQREDRHRDAPEQLGALACGRRRTSSAAVGIALFDVGQRARLGGLDAPSELVELDQAEVGRARLALVAAAVLEHHEAVAVGLLDEMPEARDGRRVLVVVDRMQEDVADAAVDGIDALDVDDDARAPELAEQAGRQDRELVARLELALVLDLALLGPRRQEQRQQRRSRPGTARRTAGSACRQAVSDWPDVNQTTISLSRYQRDSVSSTVRNSATDSRRFR